ncbi:MAG: DUF5689 domain-containing protein [Bacteroides stercoris]
MKLFNRISLLLISSLVFAACERDYDAPPLNEPKYDGPAANTTIEELRAMGATVGEDAPYTIGEEKVMKAVITANDESGNIFKKIYLQDETGAIEMEVDQNSVYNYYPVGQTVYIDLKGLSLSMYGDELQLGHPDGYLYRTPWEEFQAHVKKDSWANPENVTPLVIDDISKVNADVNGYKFKLVKFTGVTFQNGGKGTFAPEDDYGEENIEDSHGNVIMIRTSSYANFAANQLPKGKGSVTGILGRFKGGWQLTVRSADDVADFTETPGGDETPEQPEEMVKLLCFLKVLEHRRKTVTIGLISRIIRILIMQRKCSRNVTYLVNCPCARLNKMANLWFLNRLVWDVALKIKDIKNKGVSVATLTYKVGANVSVYENEGNIVKTGRPNTLKVKCNGNELTIPSKVVSSSK